MTKANIVGEIHNPGIEIIEFGTSHGCRLLCRDGVNRQEQRGNLLHVL